MSDPTTVIGISPELISGKKYLSYRAHIEVRRSYFFFKRVADIVLSIIFILVIFSWLLPLMALLLKLDSKGPVFFLQKRVGKAGHTFTCYKFRTMVVNEEAHKKQAEKNDHRITRIGRWLRKTNIDELPQFLNVLLGQMSIVGPRPHMHADCRRFARVVPRYKLRNLVKPGITGMAQVKGYHGPASDYEAVMLRYQWDIFYVRNASAWLDFKIMTRTIFQRVCLVMPVFVK